MKRIFIILALALAFTTGMAAVTVVAHTIKLPHAKALDATERSP